MILSPGVLYAIVTATTALASDFIDESFRWQQLRFRAFQ
jgi:hypothetical protein